MYSSAVFVNILKNTAIYSQSYFSLAIANASIWPDTFKNPAKNTDCVSAILRSEENSLTQYKFTKCPYSVYEHEHDIIMMTRQSII